MRVSLAIADTYLEDGLGSVSAVLREGGAVAASLSYSLWGEEELAMESLPGYGDRFERPHYGYNAELTSPEGGLQYLRARWYDPSMGAFGSRDSLLGDAADPATLNRYAYAEGNPVASCDPTGHVTRRRSMASMIARRPLYSTRARNVSRKVAAAPSTVTGAFSHAIANMRKPPRTVTGSFSGVVAGRAARRRQAVESAPYASYPSRLGSSYRQAGGRAAAVRRQFCGTAERQRDYGITPVKGSAADVLHLGLGFAGQTPVLGEPFDFADGVISLLEGDALGGDTFLRGHVHWARGCVGGREDRRKAWQDGKCRGGSVRSVQGGRRRRSLVGPCPPDRGHRRYRRRPSDDDERSARPRFGFPRTRV